MLLRRGPALTCIMTPINIFECDRTQCLDCDYYDIISITEAFFERPEKADAKSLCKHRKIFQEHMDLNKRMYQRKNK